MSPLRKARYDALSMDMLDEWSREEASEDGSSTTLIDYCQEPDIAKKEVPLSPTSKTSFSSSTMSAADWTPDTLSESSYEGAPLLEDDVPPPEYQRTVPSTDKQSPTRVCSMRARIASSICARTPRRAETNKCRDAGCSRRRKRAKIAHILIAVFLVSAFTFYFLVSSIRKHRHRGHSGHSVGSQPLPKWAFDCLDDKRYSAYSFNGIEDLEISEQSWHGFKGTIKVLPALPNQSVDLVMKTLPKTKPLNVKINQRTVDQPLPFESGTEDSRRSKLEKRHRCGSGNVILHFREGLTINNLALSTSSGAIQIHSSLQVANATTITTNSARIQTSQFFNTRKTYISSGSSSLQGQFKLYDVLSIASTSGRIDVTIEPQEVDQAHPKPAELMIASHSGSIHLASMSSPPPREYITSVESRDGMIQGTIIHGSKTIVKAQSGSVQLDILPYIFDGLAASALNINTASGTQQIKVHSPPSGKLTQMESTHTSQSGTLRMEYPAEWAGTIRGSTSSGAIGVTGHGVHIIEQGPNYVRAEKDGGKSSLTFSAASGSAHADFAP